jgi:hypothetical protein
MIGSDRRATIRTINQPWLGIRPFPTGRILDVTCSRQSRGRGMPGYHHSAPPGRAQKRSNPEIRPAGNGMIGSATPELATNVGRAKTRRAHRAANRLNRLAPVLSRAVDGPPLSGANLSCRQQQPYSLTLLSRNALATTDTELNDIAAPAMIGLRSSPKNG